jgi:hypothetical protein
MNRPHSRLLDFLQEFQIKEFLEKVLQDGSLAIAILNDQGNVVAMKTAGGISEEKMSEVFSGPVFSSFRRDLNSDKPMDQVTRAPELPLYGGALTHREMKLGNLVIWIPEEKNPEHGLREFRLIWLHLLDLIGFGFELDNLSSEIVRNYEELSLLYQISVRLGAQPDSHKICEIIVDQVHSILPSTKVIIMVVDEENKEVYSKMAVDGHGKPLPPIRLGHGKGITGQVISTRQPMIICNVHENPAFEKTSFPITSLLCVPMAVGEKAIGTINVGDKIGGAEFSTYDLKLISAIAAEAAVSLENSRLFTEVKDLYLSAVKSLVMAIDAKDPYTHSHSLRVSELSTAVAEVLGFDSRTVEDIKLAALLHDVGKIGVPEHVLLKPGKLSEEEWEAMKQHPIHSTQILEHFKPFKHIAHWVQYEHERHDGKGYPFGLKGEEIPMPSRIIAAADAFDAITSDRYYRKGRSEADAMKILKQHSGTQFDPSVIEAFIAAYEKGKLKTDLPK